MLTGIATHERVLCEAGFVWLSRTGFTVVVLLCAMTAGAGASEVHVVSDCGQSCSYDTRFMADDGELNRVTVSRSSTAILITDPGSIIRPGLRCTALSEHEVSCDGLDNVSVVTGDESDTVVVEAPAGAAVSLGSGNDRVDGAYRAFGDDGADVLTGTDNGDTLSGGAGADTLLGRPGDDTLIASDTAQDGDQLPTSDTVDGGGGRDTVSYAGYSLPVHVDLATGQHEGASGDDDQLIGMSSILGGDGNDVLTGDTGDNLIYGGAGQDILDGAAGRDFLMGGAGFDRLVGGPGDDVLDSRRVLPGDAPRDPGLWPRQYAYGLAIPLDIELEDLECGAGNDYVYQDGDVLGAGCEAQPQGQFPIVYPKLGGRHFRFRLPCDKFLRQRRHQRAGSFGGHCHVVVRIESINYFDHQTYERKFLLPRQGGVVSLPELSGVRAARDGDFYIRVTISYRTPVRTFSSSLTPYVTRYVLRLGPSCKALPACTAPAR